MANLSWQFYFLAITSFYLHSGLFKLTSVNLSSFQFFVSSNVNHMGFPPLNLQQPSTSNTFSSLKSMAAQAVATAGLNNPVSTPTDYSTESRGKGDSFFVM